MKNIWECSEVKKLQKLKIVTTFIQAAVPLMHSFIQLVCKQFLELSPTSMHHSLKHIISWYENMGYEGFL